MENQTVYSLAVTNPADSDDLASYVIGNVRILTEKEYDKIIKYITELETFASDENLFLLVEDSYDDLQNALATHLDDYAADKHSGPPKMQRISLNINRMVLGLLSSIRTYLDHTETRLKRQFSDSSTEVEGFKVATANEFDSEFAYRFTEKLRNYAQHCGLPIGTVSLHSVSTGEDELIVQFDRDMLLTNFPKGWGKVKTELENMPDKFDIVPLLSKKVELLRKINEKINKRPLELLAEPGNELLKLIVETQILKPGAPHILKISGNPDNPNFAMSYFPYEIISRVTGMKFNFV